jgi:hypothetical protein
MRVVASVLSLSVLVPLVSLSAQVHPTVEPGARVRVTAPDQSMEELIGTFLTLSDGSMQFASVSGDEPRTISLSSITRLDVSRGRKSHPWRGAGVGFLAGALAGAIIGSGSGADWDLPAEHAALLGAGFLGLVGTVVGAVAGLSIKTERWEEVPLDQPRVSLAPQRDGRLGFGLAVMF